MSTASPSPSAATTSPTKPLLEVNDLRVHFPIKQRTGILTSTTEYVRAVDGISFSVRRGETLGLVGESGCGKSTAGRAVLQLLKPTSGEVQFDGEELVSKWNGAKWSDSLLAMRQRMQMIFQDPYASLNPRMTVEQIVGEPLSNFGIARGMDLRTRVQSLLQKVGMDPRYVRRYPHEFSGGQRQRIGIARALALEPELIVADEPISALDVSIQAQILNLLKKLQEELNLTYIFIAHDLAAVRHISHRIAVMYLGHLVEIADNITLLDQPKHPYTQALISAIPIADPVVQKKRQRIVLQGEVPSPINPPSGCPFHTRCPLVEDRCRSERPVLKQIGDGHHVACHLVEGSDGAESGRGGT